MGSWVQSLRLLMMITYDLGRVSKIFDKNYRITPYASTANLLILIYFHCWYMSCCWSTLFL